MIFRRVWAVSLAIGYFWFSAVVCKADEPANGVVEQDVVYTKAGADELKLDIARPPGKDGVFPAVLVIHGGGWTGGNKSDVGPIMGQFTKRGYVAVSPQYRLTPRNVFPAQVHDVKAAVRYLKTNAKKYQIDPDRIGAIGFSAGGHLALMLGVTGQRMGSRGSGRWSPRQPRQRRGELFRSDRPDGEGHSDHLSAAGEEFPWWYGAKTKPDLAAKASPLTYVSKDDAPTLRFREQRPADPNQAIKLADAMNTAGVSGT